MVITHYDVIFNEKSLYEDNFGGDSIEIGWIGEEQEIVEIDDVQASQQDFQAPNVDESNDLEDDTLNDMDDEVQGEPRTPQANSTAQVRRSSRSIKTPN